MNGKDKISVIIPCYNVQKYIMRCFDSIYSQTYGFENLEVILIDDLSTDNTWSILESLQRQYPENVISLKIQKKGKCGGARNLGMDICTGKYITFVDADDYVHPDMLRVLYDRMTEDDYDVAQCGVSCFKADKPNVLEVNDFEIQRLDLDNVDNRKNLIIGLTGFTNVTAWAKLYSTKFIIEHNLRFIEDVYYEDTHFSMLCVLLAKKYCKVQSTLYYYFENTEGIIRSEISNAKIRDAKIIMDHIRQAIQSRKAELGNVIEQCYCEIQTFLLWHQYIEPYSRIETFMNRELDICKEEFLKSEPDIFNNPYVKFFSDDVVLKRMSRLRVTAKKMDNAYFLDNAMHICLGIHDKDGNYSVWAGTTMQSIVENTKAPIVFHVIIDEADSVLLDSAIMPLVISGVPRVQSNLYDVCDFFVTTLVEDIDYIEEDKAVWLTPKGVKFAESFFGISNFYGKENFEINRHVTLSLRAHKLLKNKKDYVVTDKKEVELFDGATGRLMHGVKLRGGQHQAIEAKEKVEISQEYRTVASVTFQNLFMMFDKMAGMSGTLMDAKDELFETYGKHVVRIPTNRPLKRVDRKDRYFKNGHDQFWTAVDDVIRLHETGQPVLVVLNSVTDTDLFSRLLIEKNIPHNVLNASNAFWEAQIIAGAGQLNAVTVATTMAGRGTDIKLGDGVKELGGLAVIGIGRMNNSRSERQARGRAGRQGDPGFSQYYVSLEDDIVGAEDDDKLQRYIDGKKRIGKRKIKRIVNQCQKLSVESEEMNRKKSLQYDQVLQRQRDLIYATRKKLLDGASVEQEKIVEIAKENISDFVNHFDCIQSNKKHGRRRGRKKDSDKNTNTQQYTSMLNRYILDNISYKLDAGLTLSDMQSAATVSDYLMLRVYQGLSRQREHIGDEEAYEQFVREATLKAVDDGWVELIDYLEQLKYAVAGRASAQRNVMFEYQNEAFESFLDTEKAVKCNIIRNILLSDVKIGKDGRLQVIYP